MICELRVTYGVAIWGLQGGWKSLIQVRRNFVRKRYKAKEVQKMECKNANLVETRQDSL
jgi:hypothetical protein